MRNSRRQAIGDRRGTRAEIVMHDRTWPREEHRTVMMRLLERTGP